MPALDQLLGGVFQFLEVINLGVQSGAVELPHLLVQVVDTDVE